MLRRFAPRNDAEFANAASLNNETEPHLELVSWSVNEEIPKRVLNDDENEFRMTTFQNILDKKTDVNLLRKNGGLAFQKPNPFPLSIYDTHTHGIKKRADLDEIVETSLKNAAI